MEDQLDNNTSQSIFESTGSGTHCTLQCLHAGSSFTFESATSVQWKSTTKSDRRQLFKSLEHYLIQTFGLIVKCCTEYVWDVHTFWCHPPSFQSQGAIYDWINIQFDTGTYPCCLAAVVILDNPDETSEQYQLVIQPAVAQTNHNSVLFCE